MAFVHFVIPTNDRPRTLQRAVESARDQTDDDRVISVVSDGAQKISLSKDLIDDGMRERWLSLGSAPRTRSGGLTRNWAKKHNVHDWVAFLDDDDVVTPTYVEHLRQHAEDHPRVEVIVFRMDHPQLGVLPKSSGRLAFGEVGISFAVSKRINDEYEFEREVLTPGSIFHEDWDFMRRLLQNEPSEKIYVSPHTNYLVRPRAT